MKVTIKEDTPLYAQYKQDIVKDVQLYAEYLGIEEWKYPYMIAWMVQENGAFSSDKRWWDVNGWANGICSCNERWRKCAPKGDYTEQRNQCINWFKGYTVNSTPQTILRDIRKGHNPNSGTYEYLISQKMKLLNF